MEHDQQFLEYVVKALVDHPEEVKIKRTVDEMGVLLLLSVHKDDMGKIIGRSGATAKAIRTILRVVGMKNDARVNLKIDEPEGSERVAGQGGFGGSRDEDTSDNPTTYRSEGLNSRQEPAKDRSLDDVLADLKE